MRNAAVARLVGGCSVAMAMALGMAFGGCGGSDTPTLAGGGGAGGSTSNLSSNGGNGGTNPNAGGGGSFAGPVGSGGSTSSTSGPSSSSTGVGGAGGAGGAGGSTSASSSNSSSHSASASSASSSVSSSSASSAVSSSSASSSHASSSVSSTASSTAASSSSTGGNISCTQPSDCPANDICDPHTKTCAASECSTTCPGSEVCLNQQGSTSGACYDGCTMFGVPICPVGETCVALDLGDNVGACVPTGTANPGASCTATPVSTGCRGNYYCADDGAATDTCQEQCNFFSAGAAGCVAGQNCIPGDLCSSAGADPATNYNPCDASSDALDYCNPSNGRIHGVCLNVDASTLDCFPFCEVGSATDCSAFAGTTCKAINSFQPSFTDTTLGVCSG